ncbi:MAG: FAD-binding protein [Eggerthellaceae bacterium]|nr:FAD-binding protein [Eggerthellaceae bacterium]
MSDHETHFEPSRRGFLKAAGVAALSAAAASGAFGLTGCGSNTGKEEALVANNAGVGKFSESIYTDVFPFETRGIPVLKKDTGVLRRGNVAYVANEIPESQIKRTEETDVLVCGVGLTGSCAALSASDDGTTRVLALEKMNVGRGMFEGMGVVGGTKMTEAGNIVDKAEMMDRMRAAADYRLPVDPIKLWADRSGEAADWMQQKFDEGDGQIETYYKPGTPSAHHYDVPQTEISFRSPQWSEKTTKNAGGGGMMIVKDFANTLSKRANVDLRFNTPVCKLERNAQGRVTGAIAKDADGYFRVNAAKGVILAMGGFESNPAMLEAWCRTEDIEHCSSWAPNSGGTGDGELMGIEIGAQMDPLPAAIMNFDFGYPEGFYPASTGLRPLLGGPMINQDGVRYAAEDLPFQARSNATNAQWHRGEKCWRLGSSTQVNALPPDAQQLIKDNLPAYVEKGYAVEADSLAELAGKMGCDAATLEATVERFNGFIDTGHDDDFFRQNLAKATKIEGDHFYALRNQSCILATVSGLVVDYSCHVLDYDNKPIEGLYAAGGNSGGFFAGEYPRHVFGPSVGRCVTFGYVSGQNAAKGE